jgi:hypothetical protein
MIETGRFTVRNRTLPGGRAWAALHFTAAAR